LTAAPTPTGRADLATIAARYARADRWAPVPEALDRAIAADAELAAAGVEARRGLLAEASRRLNGLVGREVLARYAPALLVTPRERFVLPEDMAASAADAPALLDAEGLATVSAPHAYLLSYGLLGLGEGDHLVELGTGTGYGVALASHIVGPEGRVTSIEIDPALHARAARLLAEPGAHGPAPVTLLCGDARELTAGVLAAAPREALVEVTVTYALAETPEWLLAALPDGARLVAPVGRGEEDQILLRWSRDRGTTRRSVHGSVRYVAERR
jgi:protein-L-isoaspartate(D-aspartate) O-methyltransferase